MMAEDGKAERDTEEFFDATHAGEVLAELNRQRFSAQHLCDATLRTRKRIRLVGAFCRRMGFDKIKNICQGSVVVKRVQRCGFLEGVCICGVGSVET